MIWRISVYLTSLFVGTLIGWYGHGLPGALIGIALAGALWMVIDSIRAYRLLRWLRRADDLRPPVMRGLWGELTERTRRQFRGREAQTAQSQARLQEFLAAIQASPNGVLLLDEQGRIEWCNQTAAAQFGIDAQRDLMQHVGNLLRDPVFNAYFTAGDYSGEVVVPGRQSTAARPVKLAVHLNPYGQGHRLLVSRDVTALEQAEAMRRDFVANVSHEIRTPLTVLAGFVETMQNLDLQESERARYLSMMAQQAQRMQSLVSDLLTLSRLEGSPAPTMNECTQVSTLLVECEQEARGLTSVLSGLSHRVVFACQDDAGIVGSHAEILSAMSNLVSNAIRYTPSDGRIDVTWSVLSDGRGKFSVKDSGPGIAAEHIPRLTERFYRVDRSRSRETGGTGLGLAIVKHVMQRHGGELEVDSVVGRGSTFSLLFPAVRIQPGMAAPTSKTVTAVSETG